MNIQVFGQRELVKHIEAGNPIGTHLISIGNPVINTIDSKIPDLFKESYKKICRFKFFDASSKEQLRKIDRHKAIPAPKDIQKLNTFFDDNHSIASGFDLHCWEGVSRSTAMALCLLYLDLLDEDAAAMKLIEIRPQAMPNSLILQLFDQIIGCNLSEKAAEIYKQRLQEFAKELDLIDFMDDYLEDLESIEDEI